MPASNRRLLLFDIDGTLITSGGAGEGALMDAMKQRFGVEEDLEGITIAGATDALIARMMLEKNALATSAENITALLDAYLSFLGSRLSRHSGCVLPGIVSLLDRLRLRRGLRSSPPDGKSCARSRDQAESLRRLGLFRVRRFR